MAVLLDVLCLAAAATALCRAWFLGSGWLAAAREYVRAWRSFPSGPGSTWGSWARCNVGHLLTCPLCLSTQFCLWLAFLFYAPSILLWEPWSLLARLPVYALAAAALVPLRYAEGLDKELFSREPIPSAGANQTSAVGGPGDHPGRA